MKNLSHCMKQATESGHQQIYSFSLPKEPWTNQTDHNSEIIANDKHISTRILVGIFLATFQDVSSTCKIFRLFELICCLTF